MLKEIKHLVLKEILLEWRKAYAFSGLLLYTISTIFICYLSFKRIISPDVWNALFWIIMLFSAVNGVAKSFILESRERHLYYYILAKPESIILSKIIYNLLLMVVLSSINLFFFSLFMGNIIHDVFMFIISLLLGSIGFSSILTITSAIASRADNNITLMAVLSFPLLFPLLISVMKFSMFTIMGMERSLYMDYIIILLAINIIVTSLSYLLFPYLWRD